METVGGVRNEEWVVVNYWFVIGGYTTDEWCVMLPMSGSDGVRKLGLGV